MENKKNNIFKDIKQIISFMKMTGIRLKFFAASFFFSLGLTLFNLYTVALLFPLSEGIIKSDFSGVLNLRGVGYIARSFPNVFSTSIRLFMLLVVWVYLNIIFKNVLSYLASISTDYQAKLAVSRLRNIIMDKCLSFGKSFFDKNKVAHLHHIILNSSRVIEGQFSMLKNSLVDLSLFTVFFISMVKISWQLTIVSMITFPAVNFITRKTIDKIRDVVRRSEQATFNTSDKVYNILNCIPIVKGFVKEEDEKSLFKVVSENELDHVFKAKKLSSLLAPVEDIGATTGTLFLAFGMALVIYMSGSIDPAGAFVFFYLAQRVLPLFNSLNNFRLYVIGSKREVEDINRLIMENDEHLVKGGEKNLSGLEREIEIRNLTFSYPGSDREVFSNVSFSIPKGKFTAIVGPTGSGKSTLVNLLMRFYDVQAGTIFIDGTDIREFKPESVRRKISSVSQDSLLFNDSLMSNLMYGASDDVSEEKVIDIAKNVAVHEIALKMPEKYESIINERSSNLSGGEKQRISIARALVKDSDILILDEATSALDAVTESKVVDAINRIAGSRTLIVISHRLSTIRKADHIVYIDNGYIAEKGTHEELISRRAKFYTQWELQKLS